MDVFEKCLSFTRADELKAADLYPFFTPIEEAVGNEIKVGGRPMIMVGSNNYLGLAHHPRVKQAAKDAIDRYGVGTCGSRFLTGTIDLHEKLEERLAKFMKREAALTFSTGYQTNLGIISTIAGKGDHIIIDRKVHASIIDACRLSFATVHKYRHNNMKDLERLLASLDPGAGKLIVVDGVFSMEGDIADLPGIVPLARKFGARILVDDAHGIGVLGPNGRGTPEHFGLESEIDLDHGHLQQVLRLDRRSRRRRREDHLFHQASRPAADVQRRGDARLHRLRPGHPGHARDTARAADPPLGHHGEDADELPGHGLRHGPFADAHHPRLCSRRREVFHALAAPEGGGDLYDAGHLPRHPPGQSL